MAAQETYRIHETTALVLRESGPHYGGHKDLANIKDQADRLLDLLYKDAERGYRYDTIKVKRYSLIVATAEGERLFAEFSRMDDAEKTLEALNGFRDPILEALEAAFGPVTYGPACAYANEDGRTNPYVSLCFGWKGEDTPEIRALLIEHLVADVNERRLTGPVILRCNPYFSSYDGIVTVKARLTFAGGMARTGDREGKGPVFIG